MHNVVYICHYESVNKLCCKILQTHSQNNIDTLFIYAQLPTQIISWADNL